MTMLGALQVGVLLAGITPVPSPQRPMDSINDQTRARRLYTAQRALNLAQAAIKQASVPEDERLRGRVARLRQMEDTLKRQIEELGGKPAPEVGELTLADLPTSQELNEQIRARTLNSFQQALSALRETIRKTEEMNDGESKTRSLEVMRKTETFYLQQVENLERGNLMPVMPVVPRNEKEVRRKID